MSLGKVQSYFVLKIRNWRKKYIHFVNFNLNFIFKGAKGKRGRNPCYSFLMYNEQVFFRALYFCTSQFYSFSQFYSMKIVCSRLRIYSLTELLIIFISLPLIKKNHLFDGLHGPRIGLRRLFCAEIMNNRIVNIIQYWTKKILPHPLYGWYVEYKAKVSRPRKTHRISVYGSVRMYVIWWKLEGWGEGGMLGWCVTVCVIVDCGGEFIAA